MIFTSAKKCQASHDRLGGHETTNPALWPRFASARSNTGLQRLRTTDPDGLREWYVKAFGATVKQEGNRTSTSIPGATLSFTRVDTPAPPTRGRSLEHTGFNVKNVNEYCQKLAGIGITCERPMGANTPIAMVTDPAGTRIEINQGLESR